MESMTCPECTNEISDGDTACPRCGTPVEVAAAAQAPATAGLPLMSVLSEAQPPASKSQVITTRIAAVIFIGWLAALAVFAWSAYADGYVEKLLPIWNTVFFLGTLPLVAGVFARRMWAQRWMLGIAAFTGLGHIMQIKDSGSSILYIGTTLLGLVVIILALAKSSFRHDNAHRGTVAQLLAVAVTIGSIAVYFATANSTGTERGRTAFAAEIQQNYHQAGATGVRVFVQDRTLVIESRTDTDEQVDEGANLLNAELQKHGNNAKAWVLGFDSIKVTNGPHIRVLRPPHRR